MSTKAYLMVKTAVADKGKDSSVIASKLAEMTDVEAVEPVYGDKYDFLVTVKVDSPSQVNSLAGKLKKNEQIENVEVCRVDEIDPTSFLKEVSSMPGGEGVLKCIQCGVCSASCPNASIMDYSPRKIIALIRAGRRYDVLTSNTPWVCATCYMCTVRCPRDVKPTELMHTLERMAVQYGLRSKKVYTPAMYSAFVDSIKANGRVHEFGMMLKYYLKTNPMASLKMLPVALKWLTQGRLALRPSKIKETKQIQAMLKKAQTLGGAK